MSNSNEHGHFFPDNRGGSGVRGNGEANTTTETANNSGPILQPTPRMTKFQRLVQKVVLTMETLNEEDGAIRKAKAALARAALAKEEAMLEVVNARLARDVALARRDRAIACAMDVYLTLPARVQNAALLKMSASSSATERSSRVREV